MTTTNSIIDLRPFEHFLEGHLPGAVNIPYQQLDDLWHEVPPKGTELSLCVEASHKEQALELFQERHFIVEHVYTSESLSQLPLETGANHHRLWFGNPIVEEYAHLITPTSQPISAIDVGCGSGRDVILLGLMGYDVFAVDYFDQALDRVSHSAERWNVNVTTVQMDCRKNPEKLIELIQKEQPQLIMQSRFLHRPLFDIYQEYLPKGCKIVVHTFLEGAAKFGKPKKPDFLLKNEELSERFGDWSVLLDQVHHLKDGRPLSMFIAQKQ